LENNLSEHKIIKKIHEIIYGHHTPVGKLFDLVLLAVILISVVMVMLESVEEIDQKYHQLLNVVEWIVTILFTIEYILRIITIKKPLKYILSFYGIIDLLSTLPKYLSLIFFGTQYLTAFRTLRLLRVFRILKLVRYVGASNNLIRALRDSRAKIFVFLFFVVIIAIILGTIMHLIEGSENGFDNIPKSIYWTIVTMTTVGYGDISPGTPLGQFLASIIMILGYGIIAVPTGIVSAEYSGSSKKSKISTEGKSCHSCGSEVYRQDAKFCRVCGFHLETEDE
jgi:voltage-gated potassium channel